MRNHRGGLLLQYRAWPRMGLLLPFPCLPCFPGFHSCFHSNYCPHLILFSNHRDILCIEGATSQPHINWWSVGLSLTRLSVLPWMGNAPATLRQLTANNFSALLAACGQPWGIKIKEASLLVKAFLQMLCGLVLLNGLQLTTPSIHSTWR